MRPAEARGVFDADEHRTAGLRRREMRIEASGSDAASCSSRRASSSADGPGRRTSSTAPSRGGLEAAVLPGRHLFDNGERSRAGTSHRCWSAESGNQLGAIRSIRKGRLDDAAPSSRRVDHDRPRRAHCAATARNARSVRPPPSPAALA